MLLQENRRFSCNQKIRVWLWMTSSSATPRNDKTASETRVQGDTYTCHCEKIEDFRGNQKKYMCGYGLLRHLRLLVMTKPLQKQEFG